MAHLGFGAGVSVGGGYFPLLRDVFDFGYVGGQVTLLEKQTVALAAGARTVFSSFFERTTHLSVLYGSGTIGEPELSFTVGTGIGYTEGGIRDNPFMMIGGMARLSEVVGLISENWYIPREDTPVFSAGLRLFGSNRFGDIAVVLPADGESPPLFWLGAAYMF